MTQFDNKTASSPSAHDKYLVDTRPLCQDRQFVLTDRLMTDELHTGWGIRTLSSSEISYNPISYHNGSVCPHNNAMIAEGFHKAGR